MKETEACQVFLVRKVHSIERRRVPLLTWIHFAKPEPREPLEARPGDRWEANIPHH